MISIVIPALNEEKVIANTLKCLLSLAGDYEVIVVDGGSQDRTLEIVRLYESVTLIVSDKGRAIQMNAGAAQARGEFILFLHADTLLPKHALTTIQSYENNTDVNAGGFLHKFSGDDWRLRMISAIDNYRCRRSLVFYGDQALFVRSSLFNELSGFPNQPILEDWEFGRRLVKMTSPVMVKDYVITDSRKFENIGIWKSFFRIFYILTKLKLGFSISKQHPFFKEVR